MILETVYDSMNMVKRLWLQWIHSSSGIVGSQDGCPNEFGRSGPGVVGP